VGAGNRVAADDLVALFDQILDRDVKVAEDPMMSSASPVFMTSQKRLTVALLLVVWSIDIWPSSV
jgi:hypothetical protein